MKSRLSSTIWMLVFLNGVALLAVLVLAFSAGKKAGEAGFDISSPGIVGALLVTLVVSVFLAWRFSAVQAPVQALAEFSERLAAGDPRARAEVNASNELGYIADNLNRAVAKVSKAT